MKEGDRRDQVKSQKCCPFQLFTGIDVTDADATRSGQEEVDWCNYKRDDGDHQRGGSPEGLFRVSWVLEIPTDAV